MNNAFGLNSCGLDDLASNNGGAFVEIIRMESVTKIPSADFYFSSAFNQFETNDISRWKAFVE